MVTPLTVLESWNVHLGSALDPARLGGAEFQSLLRDIERLTLNAHSAAEAHSLLGRAHRGQGDATLAEEHLRHAMRLGPSDWIAPYNLAIVLLERGEPGATREGVHLLRQLEAPSEAARLPVRMFAAEALVAHGQASEAMGVLREVARQAPGGEAGQGRRLLGLVARGVWLGVRRRLAGAMGGPGGCFVEPGIGPGVGLGPAHERPGESPLSPPRRPRPALAEGTRAARPVREAVVVAEQPAARLGVPFHFPSPDHPEGGCPR